MALLYAANNDLYMKKNLIFNTVSSVLLQIITIICGFVLPRLILQTYGSEVNGLVSSVTQFLSLISFLELGVGAVIQSSLYRPLAKKDSTQISAVLVSGNKFFKKIALILVGYVIVLAVVYPFISNQNFDWGYTALLIVAMSISSFAQYYFGIIDRLLLSADQRGYIQYTAQIVTLVANTAICAILIINGASIQLVKLMTSIIFLVRPLALRFYVNRHYNINRHIKYEGEPIKQKWNGIAQHIAAIVLDDTDTILLTILSTLSNVSIYSVHHNVVYGIKNVLISSTNGFQSVLGDYWAKKDNGKLLNFFSVMEFFIHLLTIYLFSVTAMLIVPFIRVYTNGISDVNYIQPLFAFLIVTAHALHCLRLPYHIMIKAAGHYKETQRCYIVAAIINILISIVTVYFWGLIGVAIGTLIAMFYQTIWMAIYNSRNLIKLPLLKFIKQIIFDLILCGGIVGSTFWLKMSSINYFSWIVLALEVASIAFFVTSIISIIFYKKELDGIRHYFFGKFMKKTNKVNNKNTLNK